MALLRILPALLLAFTLYTSVSEACEGKACGTETCDVEKCGQGCDGKSCEKKGCFGKACSLKAKGNCDGKACKAAKCKDHSSCKLENCDCKSCKSHDHSSGTTTTAPTTTATTTGVSNYQVTMAEGEMHCGDCAKKVSAALKTLPDVDQGSVKVVLSKNTATLQIAPGSKVTAEQIKKAIEDKTGYTVSKVEALPTTATTK